MLGRANNNNTQRRRAALIAINRHDAKSFAEIVQRHAATIRVTQKIADAIKVEGPLQSNANALSKF